MPQNFMLRFGIFLPIQLLFIAEGFMYGHVLLF